LHNFDEGGEDDEEDCPQVLALIAQAECKSSCRENCEMFEAVGRVVSSLRVGGTSDRTTIAVAKPEAVIRAVLEPGDPTLMVDSVAGMLSDAIEVEC
jgi:hypothetical protein